MPRSRTRAVPVLLVLAAAAVSLLVVGVLVVGGASPSTVFLTAWGWFVAALLGASSLRARARAHRAEVGGSGMLGE